MQLLAHKQQYAMVTRFLDTFWNFGDLQFSGAEIQRGVLWLEDKSADQLY